MTFAELKRKGSGVRYRRIFQVVFAVFFSISFIAQLFDERGIWQLQMVLWLMRDSILPYRNSTGINTFHNYKNISFLQELQDTLHQLQACFGIWLVSH